MLVIISTLGRQRLEDQNFKVISMCEMEASLKTKKNTKAPTKARPSPYLNYTSLETHPYRPLLLTKLSLLKVGDWLIRHKNL